MRVIVLFVVIMSGYIYPAAAYEYIFHEGFEGEQFPPEGWDEYGVWRVEGGYQSDWCADISAHLHEKSWLISPDIPLNGGEIYTIRFHSKLVSYYGWVETYAMFAFDDGLPVIFYVQFYEDIWVNVEVNIQCPESANSGYFDFYAESMEQLAWIDWYLDDFLIAGTAVPIETKSFGSVKALFR
jgi:hypothetical protein